MSKTREQAMETRDHIEWMKHPEWWDTGHVCPLRNKSREKEDSGIFDRVLGWLPANIDKPVVYLGCMYFPPEGKEEYNSIEELVAAGWEVD